MNPWKAYFISLGIVVSVIGIFVLLGILIGWELALASFMGIVLTGCVAGLVSTLFW